MECIATSAEQSLFFFKRLLSSFRILENCSSETQCAPVLTLPPPASTLFTRCPIHGFSISSLCPSPPLSWNCSSISHSCPEDGITTLYPVTTAQTRALFTPKTSNFLATGWQPPEERLFSSSPKTQTTKMTFTQSGSITVVTSISTKLYNWGRMSHRTKTRED